MAIGVLIEIRGCSASQYEGVVKRVGLAPPDPRRPPGMLIHTAGPIAEGWQVFDIWADLPSYERFAREEVAPACAAEHVPAFIPRVVELANVVL